MLENILELLRHVNGETENIRIAQGKYYLPDGVISAFKHGKKQLKWQKYTQQNM